MRCMLLSIVITTFNRMECLRENLDHCSQQSDQAFEVVVADDGSTDGTADMLRSYAKRCTFPLRWVSTGDTDRYALAKARNLGVLETRGDAVVILDDDSFPVPDFVAEHKRPVGHEKGTHRRLPECT